MLQIAVCDDESLLREYTAALVRRELRELGPEVDCFESGEALLQTMSAGDYTPDIAVLDIQMDGMDGISLAKRLNDLTPNCRIIFLTGFLTFATDVYASGHVYFIVKDELDKRIGEALHKALLAFPITRPVICVQGKQGSQIFALDSVLFIERVGRKTRIVTDEGEHLVTPAPAVLLRDTPEGLFIRCHQSIWVNSARIAGLRSEEFILCDGRSVPISRGFKQQARAYFLASLTGKQTHTPD